MLRKNVPQKNDLGTPEETGQEEPGKAGYQDDIAHLGEKVIRKDVGENVPQTVS